MWKWGLSRGQARQGKAGRASKGPATSHPCFAHEDTHMPALAAAALPLLAPALPPPAAVEHDQSGVCVCRCVRGWVSQPGGRKRKERKDHTKQQRARAISDDDAAPTRSNQAGHVLTRHPHPHPHPAYTGLAWRCALSRRVRSIASNRSTQKADWTEPPGIIGSHTTHFIIRSAAG